MLSQMISPYISEGSGLKLFGSYAGVDQDEISPYISEGSGLKLPLVTSQTLVPVGISPYISEGSGLKRLDKVFK